MDLSATSLLLAVGVSVGVFTLAMLVWNVLAREPSVEHRTRKLRRETQVTQVLEQPDDSPYDRVVATDDMLSGLPLFLLSLMRTFKIDVDALRPTVNLKLLQSGIDAPNAAIYYLFFKKLGWILALPVAAIVFANSQGEQGSSFLMGVLVLIVVGLLGMRGADLVLNKKKEKRQIKLMRSYPDALDLVLVCVEAGLSLDAALQRVCRELKNAHPVITKELDKTRLELTLLNDRTLALKRLAERTDMMAFRSFVSALLQSEKFGTSLAETLRVLSEDFRYTRLMIAENKAGRLPALLTLPLVGFLLPALFIIILTPAAIQVMGMGSLTGEDTPTSVPSVPN
jgi:tight adherence protein C